MRVVRTSRNSDAAKRLIGAAGAGRDPLRPENEAAAAPADEDEDEDIAPARPGVATVNGEAVPDPTSYTVTDCR